MPVWWYVRGGPNQFQYWPTMFRSWTRASQSAAPPARLPAMCGSLFAKEHQQVKTLGCKTVRTQQKEMGFVLRLFSLSTARWLKNSGDAPETGRVLLLFS